MSKFDDYLAAAKAILARSARIGVRTELRREAVHHFTQRDAVRDYLAHRLGNEIGRKFAKDEATAFIVPELPVFGRDYIDQFQTEYRVDVVVLPLADYQQLCAAIDMIDRLAQVSDLTAPI